METREIEPRRILLVDDDLGVRQTLSCSVPRFFRELSPSGLVVNREVAPRSCMVVLSLWAVVVFPNWGAGIFGV